MIIFVGLLGIVIVTLRYGAVAAVASSFALLPWLVMFEDLLPAQVGAICATGGIVVMLVLVWPLEYESRIIPYAAFFFLAVTLGHLALASDKEAASRPPNTSTSRSSPWPPPRSAAGS